jgi:hypothetical protein
MKNLVVTITESDFKKFGFINEKIFFSELLELIKRNLIRQDLYKSVNLSEKYGLSKMFMEEISAEVNAVRQTT